VRKSNSAQSTNKFIHAFLGLVFATVLIFCSDCLFINNTAFASPLKKQPIKALYIPLADHYAALVAYERYRTQMKYADFQLEQMKNWDLLRAYFQSGEADMAFAMSPLAMDMYHENPHFRWIGLMHRDGNALAINKILDKEIKLPERRQSRKPDKEVAAALKHAFLKTKKSIQIGMPHILSTHTVVLYHYLKEQGLRLGLSPSSETEIFAIAVPPAKSPTFIKRKNNRATPAAIEQSLPWVDIVETGGFGHIAWYSKDVLPSQYGHIECITLATNQALSTKFRATKEVMQYIHLAGQDIEQARHEGGEKMEVLVNIIQKHIKAHTRDAIIASLNPKLNVINYNHLNIDKPGLKLIMGLALNGGILKNAINIDTFADQRFVFTTSNNNQ